ncbi:MAG: VIT domain-containing protein, partial [Gammaproteobacteria bacterium]|nr:VIT domain-containing protein [Gammaproteobacteria bacterium]
FWTGIGMLPLAPLFSFIVALVLMFRLRKVRWSFTPARFSNTWWGVLLGLTCLLVVQVPDSLTRVGMQMAVSESEQTRISGIRMLRVIGLESHILKAGYERSGQMPYMFAAMFNLGGKRISMEDARGIYYRVTGKAFNDQTGASQKGRSFWDPEVGGKHVGGRQPELYLQDSTIDGSISANAGVAYLEWTMVLKNESSFNAEGRTQIALPPGAVVSRVTLWVNGEEREAAFAGRGKAREAYENVVRRNRDPLLVTTQGPDTVLMQMFPVLPGQAMKARIGMTVPLYVVKPEQSMLRLPYFKERNFNLRFGKKHNLWLESGQQFLVNSKLFPQPEHDKKVYRLQTAISDEWLGDPDSNLVIPLNTDLSRVVSRDRYQDPSVVVQQIKPAMSTYRHLIVVLDGSGYMQAHLEEVADFIASLNSDLKPRVLVAADEVVELDYLSIKRPLPKAVRRALANVDFAGGADNMPALLKAVEYSRRRADSAIVWLHGPQPVHLTSYENLRHQWERDKNSPHLFSYSLRSGANRILDEMDGISKVTAVAEIDRPVRVLPVLADYFNGHRPFYTYQRKLVDTGPAPMMDSELSKRGHINRLWANDRIQMYLDKGKRQQALKLAAQYQLVTPVSGAVVLENQAQYKAAGLDPVKPGSVPTIPEPEEWALMIVALSLLAWMRLRWNSPGRLQA